MLLLPLLSMVASLVTIGLFAAGAFATATRSAGDTQMSIAGWVLSAIGYCVLAIVTVYFNAALVSAANERLAGGDPTFDSALAGANRHLPQIIGWGLISATVSMVLRQIQENAGLLGKLVAGIAGIAWSLVTYLVLPVLVIEGVSVRQSITRSRELFSRTWGERVVGSAGIGLIGFLAMLPALAVVILAGATGVDAVIIGAIVLALVWVVGVMCVTTAMSMIFQTALYRYAALGQVPVGFDATVMTNAFRPRRGARAMPTG